MSCTLLVALCLLQIFGANSSDFRVRLTPHNGQPNAWDPQWHRPPGQPEELVLYVRNCDQDHGNAVITMIPADDEHDVFSFFLGANGNAISGLLRNNEQVYSVMTPDILGCDDYDNAYWITWSSSERWLALGTGSSPGNEALFLYISDKPVSIEGHQLSANGSRIFLEYVIPGSQVEDIIYSHRERKYFDEYGVFLSAENKTAAVFQVLAFGHVYVCLSQYPFTSNCFDSTSYRILIGAEENSRTVGYDGDMLVAVAGTPQVLSPSPEMKTFWVSWEPIDSHMVVAVGVGSSIGESVLLSFTPENIRDIETIALTSARNHCSEWILTP